MVFEFTHEKEMREKSMSQLCENLVTMKLTAEDCCDLKKWYYVTININKYCSKK